MLLLAFLLFLFIFRFLENADDKAGGGSSANG